MSNDWDVIEEMEFWDDYHAIYGPEPISRRKQKKINKYNKRKAKEEARKQKEADRKQKEMIRKEVSRQLNQTSSPTPSVNPTDGTGCLVTVLTVVIVIVLIAVGLF